MDEAGRVQHVGGQRADATMLPSRMLGTETLIEASGIPERSRTATATAATPSELSSQLSA